MTNKIKIIKSEILSDQWYTLKKITYDYRKNDGTSERQDREVYDRGNGATILLYNAEQKSVILTKQFRLPTFLNGNETGMLIETCAGLLEEDLPEDCARREAEEETGYKVSNVEKIFEIYMSPGAVTEIIHFFIAQYAAEMRKSLGGGLAQEQEEIEVLELNFDKALQMIDTGEIKDGKTIILLQHMRMKKIL